MTIGDAGFVLALLCAALMGFAIQRGGTCTVAAVHEIVLDRSATRLSAMLEAALWVLGCLLLSNLLGLTMLMPPAHGVGVLTVVGGALLGVGAAINGACVFGAIARLGSGDWAYLATPVGFYLGCLVVLSVTPLGAPASVPAVTDSSVIFMAPVWIASLLAVWMTWRALVLFRPPDAPLATPPAPPSPAALRVWTPRAATITIGLSFFVLVAGVGPWAYTDVLTEFAQRPSPGMTAGLAARSVLLLVLLAGALMGGWTAGRTHRPKVTCSSLAQRLMGSALMGAGACLIPGGNDGLLLVGLPLLLPYAVLALVSMGVSVALWLLIARKIRAAR